MNTEFERMAELAGLGEIKVNAPMSPRTQLEQMLEFNETAETSLLETFSAYSDFNEYSDDFPSEDPEVVKLARIFYKWIGEKNIIVITVGEDDDEDEIELTKSYKRIITYGLGYDNSRVILSIY